MNEQAPGIPGVGALARRLVQRRRVGRTGRRRHRRLVGELLANTRRRTLMMRFVGHTGDRPRWLAQVRRFACCAPLPRANECAWNNREEVSALAAGSARDRELGTTGQKTFELAPRLVRGRLGRSTDDQQVTRPRGRHIEQAIHLGVAISPFDGFVRAPSFRHPDQSSARSPLSAPTRFSCSRATRPFSRTIRTSGGKTKPWHGSARKTTGASSPLT